MEFVNVNEAIAEYLRVLIAKVVAEVKAEKATSK